MAKKKEAKVIGHVDITMYDNDEVIVDMNCEDDVLIKAVSSLTLSDNELGNALKVAFTYSFLKGTILNGAAEEPKKVKRVKKK